MHGRGWWGVVGLFVGLACAAPAQAGQYRVWTCHGPDGSVTPIRDSSYGWIPSLRANTQQMTLADRCGDGGGIYAHLGGTPALAAGGTWSYVPPPGTSIGAFSITWSGVVSGGGEATITRSDKPDPEYPERNVGGAFASHTVAQSNFDIAGVALIAACSFSPPTCGADPVDFTATRAVITLHDFHTPDATEVSGDLVGTGPLRGVMSVSLAATDVGG